MCMRNAFLIVITGLVLASCVATKGAALSGTGEVVVWPALVEWCNEHPDHKECGGDK